MSYRSYQQNYWPWLHFAAALTGMFALVFLVALICVIYKASKGEVGGNPWMPFGVLGSLLFIYGGACIGVYMRKWWGRGIMTFVAVPYLLMIPFGTILGFFVLRGLSVHRRDFK